VDAGRFSVADIRRLETWLYDKRAAKLRHHNLASGVRQKVVDSEHQAMLDQKASTLEVAKPKQPWWMAVICQHRCDFANACISKDWDREQGDYPPEVFVMILAVQQPGSVAFLKGSLNNEARLALHATESGAQPDFMSRWAYYECEVGLTDASDIDIGEDDDFFVLPSLWHAGQGVTTGARPLPFDEFCRCMGRGSSTRASGGGDRKRTPVVPKHVFARLLEMYPWLSESDIAAAQERAHHRDRSDCGGAGGRHHAPRLLAAADLEEEAFEAIRDWKFLDEDVSVNFYTHVAGGVWTKTFKDVVADRVDAKSRAHVRDFCERFGWPKLKVFHMSAHSEAGAHALAREWCRKGNHYFSAWIDSVGIETFETADSCPYVESLEFLDWAVGVEVVSKTWDKISELKAARPVLQNARLCIIFDLLQQFVRMLCIQVIR
jgi:hypothetical protein